jgi:hypothetical protein
MVQTDGVKVTKDLVVRRFRRSGLLSNVSDKTYG